MQSVLVPLGAAGCIWGVVLFFVLLPRFQQIPEESEGSERDLWGMGREKHLRVVRVQCAMSVVRAVFHVVIPIASLILAYQGVKQKVVVFLDIVRRCDITVVLWFVLESLAICLLFSRSVYEVGGPVMCRADSKSLGYEHPRNCEDAYLRLVHSFYGCAILMNLVLLVCGSVAESNCKHLQNMFSGNITESVVPLAQMQSPMQSPIQSPIMEYVLGQAVQSPLPEAMSAAVIADDQGIVGGTPLNASLNGYVVGTPPPVTAASVSASPQRQSFFERIRGATVVEVARPAPVVMGARQHG